MTTDDEMFEQIVQGQEVCDHDHDGPCVTAQEVFGFDPADEEQYDQVAQWTRDLFELMCGDEQKKQESELSQNIFRTGPDGLFISFVTLASIAQESVVTAFGPEVADPESSVWRLGQVQADDTTTPEDLEPHLFAGAFMTAFMNDDHEGAKKMFQAKIQEPFIRVLDAYRAMIWHTKHLLFASVHHNPEAFLEGDCS